MNGFVLKLIKSFTGLVAILFVAHAPTVLAQPATSKIYRGAVGNSHIQMRLNFTGSNVTGTYAYDTVGEDLKLTGHVDAQGALALSEVDNKGKPTGKFVCKRSLDDPVDPDCSWSRPDGTREAFATLTEQHIAFTNGLQITPKTITNRKSAITVSYPQITNSGGTLTSAAQNFNRRMLGLVQKAIADFEPIDGKGSFDTNYNIALATNDLVSIEMVEFSDGGGAHPNNRFWTLTYDLATNKELRFEDLFKPNSEYNDAIAKYVVADIDKRADALEADEARRDGRKPNQRDQSIVSADHLSELSGWTITPKGMNVYFDLPHVIAFFDKTFVPYGVIADFLKPNGPAARFQ
jgi:hypothetical protein